MYEALSWFLKYIFIILIYIFIYRITKLIYLDIKLIYAPTKKGRNISYLKLINLKDQLNFAVKENYILNQRALTIGRKDSNDLIIADPFLSSKHARLFYNNGIYYIEDLASSNGTYVNGIKIVESTPLKDGDRISLGQLSFILVQKAD